MLFYVSSPHPQHPNSLPRHVHRSLTLGARYPQRAVILQSTSAASSSRRRPSSASTSTRHSASSSVRSGSTTRCAHLAYLAEIRANALFTGAANRSPGRAAQRTKRSRCIRRGEHGGRRCRRLLWMCRRIILHSFTTHTSLVWLLFLRYLTLLPPATVHRCLRPSSARIHSSPVSTPDSHLIDLLFLFYVRIIVCGLDSRPRVFLSSSSLFSLTPESSSSLSHLSIHQRPPCV